MPASPKTVAIIGAPSDIGAGIRGGSMGPDALRVAGLFAALRRLGHDTEDWGNLAGPQRPADESADPYRNLREVAAWCALVRDRVYAALMDQRLPILAGGDHSLSIGSIAALSRYCMEQHKTLAILWLDAHADFNTLQTSPSGNLHGMPAAVVAGHGPADLLDLGPVVPMVDPRHILQVGIRSVDEAEKVLVAESGIVVFDMRTIDEDRMRGVMIEVLNRLVDIGGHVHVSFDVDFLDPEIAPGVATAVPGGPTYREAQLCMELIYDSGLMGSLDIMELNPARDRQNDTASLVVELVESLFGQQILSRSRETDRT